MNFAITSIANTTLIVKTGMSLKEKIIDLYSNENQCKSPQQNISKLNPTHIMTYFVAFSLIHKTNLIHSGDRRIIQCKQIS